MFLNLSPFRYNLLLHNKQGPIQKMNIIELQFSEKEKFFEVQCFLKEDLKSNSVETSAIYGKCDSTGTDKYLHYATWKSISELIERWAFHKLLSSNSNIYGMNIDRTSTGFAALPCWPKKYVRTLALGEALERWAITNWWLGNVKCTLLKENFGYSTLKILKIDIPESLGFVTITFGSEFLENKKLNFYGFAYGKNLKLAVKKARVEMMRNRHALMAFQNNLAHCISDQRLLYFSSEEGATHFNSKIKNNIRESAHVPEPIIDSKIDGEWSQYATVWRCLLPNTKYQWSDTKYFIF